MIEKLLDAIFPRTCPVCGGVLPAGEKLVCPGCRQKATLIMEPTCRRCGKSIARVEDEYCFDCKKHGEMFFDRGFAVWEYDTYMKESVARFKYGGRREYVDFFVEEVFYHYGSRLSELELDCVVPVPLHRERLRYRGFNQAELLAQGIAKKLHVPMVTGWLIRSRSTLPQKGLNDKQRYDNLKQAFSIETDVYQASGKSVLLVDDIYTTGTTLNQCAKELKDAGVRKVYFICLCTGKDF